MLRLGATLILASALYAQNGAQREIASAAKSPIMLARYVDAHPKDIDWGALWSALGTQPPKISYVLCGNPNLIWSCSTEIVTLLDPDQSILIVHNDAVRGDEIYLRYLQQPDGGWKFAGLASAVLYDDFPRRHDIMRMDGKPFLIISNNLSQAGGGFSQRVEDWYDLTLPDFEPVFSFTAEASLGNFGGFIGRQITAVARPVGETINVTINIEFTWAGRHLGDATLNGVYVRKPGEGFSLSRARSLLTPGPVSNVDFEALASNGPASADEASFGYAYAGLEAIARGSDADAKGWLRMFLKRIQDSPRKRSLLQLLAKP